MTSSAAVGGTNRPITGSARSRAGLSTMAPLLVDGAGRPLVVVVSLG